MNNIDSARAENESVSDTSMCALTDTDLAMINGSFGCGPQGPWCYGNTSFGGFYEGNCQFGGGYSGQFGDGYGGQFRGGYGGQFRGGYGGQFGDGWSSGRRRCNY